VIRLYLQSPTQAVRLVTIGAMFFEGSKSRCRHRATCLIFVLTAAVHGHGDAAGPPRYVGRTADGQWIQGEQLSDWHRPDGTPKLDGQPLFSEDAPIRWLLDQTLPLPTLPNSFVETTTGDRLPGSVVAFRGGDQTPFQQQPEHFLVQSEADVGISPAQRASPTRVSARHVQRIVWHRRRSNRLQPRTLFLRDGGQVEFRAARFSAESVTLLLEDGTRKIPFSDIAELHFKSTDSWHAHFDELCLISPDGLSRILQVVTVRGLIATASMSRFDARVRGDSEDSGRWLHGVQPAWSLDMIWVRCADIRLRRSFAPDEVPLARIRPEPANRLMDPNSTGWPWRLNENVLGGPLRAGGKAFGWGFGVHAAQELRFPLPASALTLETWLGLDHVVGQGGCARGRIVLEHARDKPLYESPLLVGSNQVAASGPVLLPDGQQAPRKLILISDAAHDARPPGADPWEIRDFLDWGDPLIKLRPQHLPRELERHVANNIAAWRGWQVQTQDTGLHGVNVVSSAPEKRGGFDYAVGIHGSALELARRVTIGPLDRWLVVHAAATEPSNAAARLEVSIDGVRTVEAQLPVESASPADAEPLAFELAASLRGQTHEIRIRQLPITGSAPVVWRGISLSPHHPSLFRVLEDNLPDVGRPGVTQGTLSGEQGLPIAGNEKVELSVASPIVIRERAHPGEYRFVRFAFRQQGQGSLRIELHQGGAGHKPFVMSAGPDASSEAGARSVWSGKLPDRWIVITRDVFGDFGACELRSITLSHSGTGRMLFDQMYFARRQSDFETAESQ